MHELILWCGFLGAWLLVLGPVYQAALELIEEEFESDRIHARMAEVPRPDPVSTWWLLLPPVWWFKRHQQRDAFQHEVLYHLTDEEYDAFTSYMSKATGWLFVGFGGLLIAAKETYELVEAHEWPTYLFWSLIVVMTAVSIANAVYRTQRDQKLRALRAERSTPAEGVT